MTVTSGKLPSIIAKGALNDAASGKQEKKPVDTAEYRAAIEAEAKKIKRKPRGNECIC